MTTIFYGLATALGAGLTYVLIARAESEFWPAFGVGMTTFFFCCFIFCAINGDDNA